MDVRLAYLGRSAVTSSGGQRTVNFCPNLSRDPVAFDAELALPLRFREAISALHDVVVSDLRFVKRDKSAYRQWKQDQTRREAAMRREVYRRAAEQVRQAEQAVPRELKQQHKQAVKRYWKARDVFNRKLYRKDRSLWMILDPVITVADDVVYFECFSKDESSYGCLSMDRGDGFGASDQVQFGTTNVDYSWDLYNHFQGLRSYRQTRFSIDPQGFEVAIDEQPDYREEKVALPSSWLRGFMQLQGAMGLPMRCVSLTREAVYSILAFLKRHKAKTSPRAVRFELLDGRPPAVVLEPWEKRIVSYGSEYRGPNSEPIRIWGRRRLLSLARVLPLCDRVDVFLLGTGFPSFWVARMGEMQLTLGLSGWTTNDWTRASALDLLAPPVKPDPATIERVSRFIRARGAVGLSEVANDALCTRAEAAAALNHLAHTGQVIHDLSAGLFRWRQVMAQAVGEAEIGPENKELRASRRLVVEGRVRIMARQQMAAGTLLVSGQSGGKPVEALLDADGLFKRARCVCSHHFKAGIRMGPCRHLLALRHVALASGDGQAQNMATDAWYDNLTRFGG